MDETMMNLENMENLKDTDDAIMDMMKMINTVELLQSHFEFVVAMLGTNSEEEVEKVKERHSLVRDRYSPIKSKEDIAQIPAKYVIVTMHEKLFLELQRTLKRCFRKHSNGDIQLIKSADNIARVKNYCKCLSN